MRRISVFSAILLFLSLGFAAGVFEDNGDGTVSDHRTGLMWQQATAGPMDWGQAVGYCNSLVLAGYDDWRLPNVNESMSIIDPGRRDPTIDTSFFPDTKRDQYWTSVTVEDHDERAWHVNFGHGHEYEGFKSNYYYVRAVR